MPDLRRTVTDRASLLLAAVTLAAAAPVWAQVTNPNGVAVIIGNKTYTHERVPQVSYADRDAAAFSGYVTDVLGFDPVNVIELLDATQADMESVFGNERSHEGTLWSYLDPEGGSDVVVFYSGHGVPGLRDRRGYLLPTDANPDTADLNGYPIDVLYENLGRLEEARSVTVYLDACFSGDSHAGMLVRSASPVYVQAELPETSAGEVTVLTASSGNELASWDEEARHGLFTNHLLDALYGKADADGDAQVTAAEVEEYLRRHMTRAARRQYRRHQNATLLGPGGVVLTSAAGGVFPSRPVLVSDGAGSGVGVGSRAEAPERTTVEQDKYLRGMALAHEASDPVQVLEYAGKLRELGGPLPAVMAYFEGLAYVELRRHEEADEVLSRYLVEAGTEDERYEEVLDLLLALEEVIAAEDRVYEQAMSAGTAAAYGEYLAAYPSGRYAEDVRGLQAAAEQEAEQTKDNEAYGRARSAATAAAYSVYLKVYPRGRHAEEARRLQAEARDDEAFARARSAGTAQAYLEYLNTYSHGRHAEEVRRLLAAGLEWTLERQGSGIISSARPLLPGLFAVASAGARFVAVGSEGAIVHSSDGDTWKLATDSPTAETLKGVAWNGMRFVAVGSRGTIVHSSDGDTWKLATDSGISAWIGGDARGRHRTLTWVPLEGVAWNGTRFVAVGMWGTIVHSSDGDTWQLATDSATGNSLRGVTWNGTRFVAVGDGERIVHSRDGDTWRLGAYSDASIYSSLWGVAWNGTRFVAVGDRIVHNRDGDAWKLATDSAISEPLKGLKGVAWNGMRFVAVGRKGTIVHSKDGDTWKMATHSDTSEALAGVAWNGKRFVAVGEQGTIVTSP